MQAWLRGSLLASLLLGGLVAYQPALASPVSIPNCRFGITVMGDPARFNLSALGVGGYLDWRQSPQSEPPPGIDYIHVVRLRGVSRKIVYGELSPELLNQFEESLRTAVTGAPGQAWLIGNEPDTAFETQDSLTPEQYALAYHNLYRLIKTADPTAQVGVGTLVQPTPLRLQWLDAFWAAYAARYQARPPSDFWSIHSFILRENRNDWGTGIPPGLSALSGELYSLDQTNSLDIFSQRLFAFRQWLAAHGQRLKPLWITEYGSLLPHDGRNGLVTQTPERARDYMLGTFKFLTSAADPLTGYPYDGNHLVQRWFWYSLDDDLWRFGGSLYDPATSARTLIGDSFVSFIQETHPQPSLQLAIPPGGALTTWPRHTGDLVLARVVVSNQGSTAASQPLTVTWFNNHPDQGGQALAISKWAGPLPGCGAATTISAWLPYPSGSTRTLFVRLESGDLAKSEILALTPWLIRPSPP